MAGPLVAADAALADLASRQHGLLTHHQLLDHGLDPHVAAARLRSGRWIRWHHGVYLVAGSPRDWRTSLHAACLATDGVASHRSAGALWDLDGFRPGMPEVTVGAERWTRRRGIRVHASDLEPVDVVTIDGIATSAIDRLVLDLGRIIGVSGVRALAFEALNRKLTTWDRLADVYDRVGGRGRPGSAALRALLDEHFGRPVNESPLEDRAERLLVRAGLPHPERQVRVDDRHGFVARVDLAYEDLKIAIEVDSIRWHLTPDAFERDRRKRNRLRVAGWLVIEITDRMLREQPEVVVSLVREARRARLAAA